MQIMQKYDEHVLCERRMTSNIQPFALLLDTNVNIAQIRKGVNSVQKERS